MEEKYTVEFYSSNGRTFNRKFVLDPDEETLNVIQSELEKQYNTKINSMCIMGPSFLYTE